MKRTFFLRMPVAASLLLLFGLFAFVPSSAASDFFLHSSTTDFLDNTSPTATTAKFKDSPAVNRTTYQEIGTWTAAPAATWMRLGSLSDLHVWIGLKNSDDQGTYFDLRAELRKNGVVIASGETKTIQGVTRNPALAKEVAATFGPISGDQFSPGDVLSIKILTKVADSGGHANAVGLRLYYDAVSRPSRFGAVFENIAVTEVIPPQGGTIQLSGFGSVTFPPGAFTSEQLVTMSVTSQPETHESFSATAEGPRVPYEIRINTGNVAPLTSFDVILNVPESFSNALLPDHQLEIFTQPREDRTIEALGHFYGFPSVFDAPTRTLRTTFPPEAFSNETTADESYEAILIIGDMPKYPPDVGAQGSTLDRPIKSAKAKPLMLASLNLFSFLAEAMPVCEGSPLGSPLEGDLRVTDSFNPGLPHTGVDYGAPLGTNVHPVLPGTVTRIDFQEEKLARPHPRTGGMVRGWGRYVVITHNDGSQTLYAHMIPESTNHLVNGVTVSPTDVIGQVGVSGGVRGAHLHLEYSPTGRIFVKRSLVDPHPCVLEGQAPPEPLVLSPQNPTLTCPDGSVTFTASGGRPGPDGYTWSVSNPNARITVTGVNKENMELRPPENPGANLGGDAYTLFIRGGSDCTIPGGRNYKQETYRCDDSQAPICRVVSWSGRCCEGPCNINGDPTHTFQYTCNDSSLSDCGPGSQLMQCINGGDSCALAGGSLCDTRTQSMIAGGCRPCAPEMQGAVVTVTDSAGATASTPVAAQP